MVHGATDFWWVGPLIHHGITGTCGGIQDGHYVDPDVGTRLAQTHGSVLIAALPFFLPLIPLISNRISRFA